MLLSMHTSDSSENLGVRAETKRTPIITKEEENSLWDQGVLGAETPESLLRAVFYYNGKNFCLRGGSKHRNLRN